MEDPRNFPRAAKVITWICNTRMDLKVWDHLSKVRDAFPDNGGNGYTGF